MKVRIVKDFKLVEKLGEGGMGEVFKGLDMMLERDVAVKALRPELMSRQDVVERFRSEAIALAKLNHSNIATLYTFFQHDKQYFMVLEYVSGETLDLRLRRDGALTWTKAAQMVCQVLKGLEHAHQMGIIHRDIKPGNLMIAQDGTVKLMDFGIARILETARLTQIGRLVGTLEYISPEQVEGKETDARSDIYSLGAVFYEMLTGRIPFSKNTDFELIKAQIEERPQPPSRVIANIPPALEKFVLRMLNKNPDKRFPDAKSCRIQLEQILDLNSSMKIKQSKSIAVVFQTYWKKYPGVVVLMVAGSIAGLLLISVSRDILLNNVGSKVIQSVSISKNHERKHSLQISTIDTTRDESSQALINSSRSTKMKSPFLDDSSSLSVEHKKSDDRSPFSSQNSGTDIGIPKEDKLADQAMSDNSVATTNNEQASDSKENLEVADISEKDKLADQAMSDNSVATTNNEQASDSKENLEVADISEKDKLADQAMSDNSVATTNNEQASDSKLGVSKKENLANQVVSDNSASTFQKTISESQLLDSKEMNTKQLNVNQQKGWSIRK